jgi:hypothetical protein
MATIPIHVIPENIPKRATEKIDFRCFPEFKARVKEIAEKKNYSMSKIMLDAFDIYSMHICDNHF